MLIFLFPLLGCSPAPPRLTTGPLIEFYYYYGSNCHLCQEFLSITVPTLEHAVGARLKVIQKDVLQPDNLKEFAGKTDQLGVKAEDLPAVIIGHTVLQGKSEIDQNLETELRRILQVRKSENPDDSHVQSTAHPADQGIKTEQDTLTFITVISSGLLDGINPCVFSTLIFLLAYLAYAGKTRRQILLIGIFYTVTVFVSYFLIGLGFFKVLHAASGFPIAATIIEIVLVCALVIFAGLSLYDFILIKRGRAKDIVLQLPDTFKQHIRKTIRTQAATAAIVASAVVLGFLVSVFELACTGQIYFPIISMLAQTRKSLSDYIYLAIYNLCFILPLLIVFILTYKGLSSEKLTAFFQRHMATVKICTVVLFLGLIALVVLI